MINYITDQGGQRFPKAPNYNNEPTVPSVNKEKAKAGDILLAKADGQKIFVTPEMWTENKDLYENIKDGSDPLWTPIGIVVVPYTHTPDGTVRCCYWFLSNRTGTAVHVGSWFSDALIELENTKTVLPSLSLSYIPYGTNTVALMSYPATFADDGYPNGSLGNELYDPVSTLKRFTPAISPYIGIEQGKNPNLYIDESKKIDGTILFSDVMDGKNNTREIYLTFAGLAEDHGITNPGFYGDYIPAFAYALEYSTVGTKQGDWYIPSLGEEFYRMARSGSIKKAYTAICGSTDDFCNRNRITSTIIKSSDSLRSIFVDGHGGWAFANISGSSFSGDCCYFISV